MNPDAPGDAPGDAPDLPVVLPPRWRSLLLVCGECERRDKGAKPGTAKMLTKALLAACREADLPRPRRVVTRCMGACPKKACTLAGIAADGRTTLLAMARRDDPVAAVRLLYAPAEAPAVSAVAAAAATASAASNSTSSAPSPT